MSKIKPEGAREDRDLPGPGEQDPSPDLAPTLVREPGGPPRSAGISLPRVERDRYAVSREVAHGGLGRILAAHDVHLDRPVAIKELLDPRGPGEARFVGEALVTARLQHPSIVPVYEAGRWPSGEPFFAMKLVSGRSLAEIIAGTRTLDQRLALLPHVIDVADAMAYAHTERIIHRDLKPANILIGAFGETVVIDWGLAKDLAREPRAEAPGAPEAPGGDGGQEDAEISVAGSVIGTPAYMPPEQATGAPVDERADVYALGAILYHLLSGIQPYDRGSSAEILNRVLLGPPPPLSRLRMGIPGELLTIVSKAMARDPSDRYPSARELAEDLRRFQRGKLVAAHQYSRRDLLRRYVRRYRTVVAVVATALLVLGGVGTVSVRRILAERDRAERKQAEAEAASREAERARHEADERADALTLRQAREAAARDPNQAIAWLRSLPPGFSAWPAVRTIAADARAHGLSTVLRGHEKMLNDLLFTPDGRRLISSDDDRTVRVWDLATGRHRILSGFTDEAWPLEVSPDGRTVACGGKEGVIRLWDLETGEGRVLRGHEGPVTRIRRSRDGRRLYSIGFDGTLRVWDLATGQGRILRDGLGMGSEFMLSADEGLVALRSGPSTVKGDLSLLDLKGGGDHRFLEPRGEVLQVALSPRGDLVATGGQDQTVRLWDVRSGRGRILGERLGAVGALDISPDGRYLAAAGDAAVVWLWDLTTGKALPPLRGHEGVIRRLVFSPDSRHLASGSFDRTVWLWEVDTGRGRALHGFEDLVSHIAFSPDGKRLAAGSVAVRLFPVEEGLSRAIPGPGTSFTPVQRSPDGQHLASGGRDGKVRLWSAPSWALKLLEGHQGGVRALRFVPGSRRLASVGDDGTVRLWGLDGHLERALPLNDGPLSAIAFSQDGRSFAVGAASGTVWLGDTGGGPPRPLRGHTGAISEVAFSPDGRRLASASADRTARIWDVATAAARPPVRHEDAVTVVDFSPDGRTLVTGSLDHTLGLWDPATLQGRRVQVGGGGIVQVLFAPDGRSVFTVSLKESAVRRWELQTGREQPGLPGHQGEVNQLTLSPDGARLASASVDGTVKLWDLATGSSRILFGHQAVPRGVAFLRDGQEVAAVADDGTLRIWPDDLPLEPAALRAWLDTVDPSAGAPESAPGRPGGAGGL